jgi:maltose O-acetyltransferase
MKHIGKSSSFMRNIQIRKPININVGDNVIINQQVLLDARGGSIIIGNNVDIAQETNIWTLEHNPHDDYHSEKRGDVIIEDYVWIASRCTILPGIRIGYGAVVATGAVVTKDVLPYTIVGGIPAKFLSKRKSNPKYILKNKSWFR